MTADSSIRVQHLSKLYRVQRKPPGLLGSLGSLFHREYDDVRAVDDVSFEIERGELVGFLGPNGAGKTTTLKVLAGLLHPSQGEVRVLGYEPYRRERAFQRRFALLLGQKNQLWWDLPASESFALNKEIYGITDRDFRDSLDELVSFLDLESLLGVQVRKLSLGERMKCELAGALLHRPEVLFLDEPTIGLDVVMQQKIRVFVAEYNRRHAATIILTSHYMADVTALCERVIIVNQGRLVYDGRLSELVRRHADYKLVTVDFESSVARESLQKLGELVEWAPRRATLRVPRSEVSGRTAAVLADFAVADLVVQEPQVDDVIRELFGAFRRRELPADAATVGEDTSARSRSRPTDAAAEPAATTGSGG